MYEIEIRSREGYPLELRHRRRALMAIFAVLGLAALALSAFLAFLLFWICVTVLLAAALLVALSIGLRAALSRSFRRNPPVY